MFHKEKRERKRKTVSLQRLGSLLLRGQKAETGRKREIKEGLKKNRENIA